MIRVCDLNIQTPEEFNARFPIGTKVRYWKVLPADVAPGLDPVETETRSEAWALGHGAVVVKVKGISGGVLISHLDIVSSGQSSALDEFGALVLVLEGKK